MKKFNKGFFDHLVSERIDYSFHTNGSVVVRRDVDLSDSQVTELPKNLTVYGFLDLMNTNITELPENLTVGTWLRLEGTHITKLPKTLRVSETIKGFIAGKVKKSEAVQLSDKARKLPEVTLKTPMPLKLQGEVNGLSLPELTLLSETVTFSLEAKRHAADTLRRTLDQAIQLQCSAHLFGKINDAKIEKVYQLLLEVETDNKSTSEALDTSKINALVGQISEIQTC
jgi:Leucine-rich repeat (LRR) protein